MSEMLTSNSYWVKIFIAGPLQQIEQVCREYVLEVGLCVTVTPTKFMYTGGEEVGVEIGLINYARFPTEPEVIEQHAVKLADEIMKRTCQLSYTILTPTESKYYSRRDEVKR